jgi:hypothetical protein
VAAGKMPDNGSGPVMVRLTMPEIGLDVEIDGRIELE